MSNSYVLGLDGGGTKTRALALSRDGIPVARAEGGPLNHHGTSMAAARNVLRDLLESVRKSAPGPWPPDFTVIGSAAFLATPPAGDAARLIEGLLPLHATRVTSDGEIALEGATGGRPGVLLIAGTGAIALARDVHGRCLTTSGLGPLIANDPGSALWIAGRLIANAGRASRNGRRPSFLSRAVLSFYDQSDFECLLKHLYSDAEPARRIAALAEHLAGSALADHPDVQSTFVRAGQVLARDVAPLLEDGRPTRNGSQVTLYIAGSVLENNAVVRDSLKAALEKRLGLGVDLRAPIADAVAGAAHLALAAAESRRAPSKPEVS